MLLSGRKALITGAARGIGLAIAQRFAAEGCSVIMTDILQAEGEAAAQLMREQGKQARFIGMNVTDEQQVRQTFESIDALDILVNNAGRTRSFQLERMTLQDWNDILSINLDSVFLGCKYAMPLLKRSSQAAIVNMSSVNAFNMNPDLSAYSTSKAGVIALTQQLAVQYAPQGVRVNCLSPGLTSLRKAPAEDVNQQYEIAMDCYPLGRAAHPSEIANAALFLASDLSSFVNGINLVVDGGMSLQSVSGLVRPELRQRWKSGKYRLNRS